MPAARPLSGRALFERLQRLRAQFGGGAAREKRDLLAALSHSRFRDPHLLKKLHALLCFLRAFPDGPPLAKQAGRALALLGRQVRSLNRRQRQRLAGSGMAHTVVRYEFSYPVARWLACNHPQDVAIDWAACENPQKLDDILVHLAFRAEWQSFDDGEISAREWMRQAAGAAPATDLTWLIQHMERVITDEFLREQLYDAAEVPLRWSLGEGGASITNNMLSAPPRARRTALRRCRSPRREIVQPLSAIRRLPSRQGRRVIDVVVAALAARQREVYAMNYANPEEVYVGDVGLGAQVVVLGVWPNRRLSLEGNYGHMIFSNGVPIGYGGVSPLFHQANTGINIFAEYRGSEAAFLFVQALRVFHALFGSTLFIANPYQFGRGNPEAIASGALWFYYKLGFRPLDDTLARMAAREYRRLRQGKRRRTPPPMLRTLADGDLHLRLSGFTRAQFFDERWLGICAAGATRRIAEQGVADRAAALRRLASRTARRLGVSDRRGWPAAERAAFEHLAPVVALVGDLDSWKAPEKRALVRLMRAKASARERRYVNLLRSHERLRRGLARYCADRQ